MLPWRRGAEQRTAASRAVLACGTTVYAPFARNRGMQASSVGINLLDANGPPPAYERGQAAVGGTCSAARPPGILRGARAAAGL